MYKIAGVVIVVLGAVCVATFFLRGNTQTEPVGAKEDYGKVEADRRYYAEIAEDGTVLRVIVATPEFIASGALGGMWIEASKDGQIRKNAAGIGDRYDAKLDAFIDPKPTTYAVLDEETAKWIVPEKVKEPDPIPNATSK